MRLSAFLIAILSMVALEVWSGRTSAEDPLTAYATLNLSSGEVAKAAVNVGLAAEAAPPLGIALVMLLGASSGDDSQACCRLCQKGKACGDSCIARSKTCQQPAGCACDG